MQTAKQLDQDKFNPNNFEVETSTHLQRIILEQKEQYKKVLSSNEILMMADKIKNTLGYEFRLKPLTPDDLAIIAEQDQEIFNICVSEVCEEFGISYETLRSQSRKKPLIIPRQLLVFFLRWCTSYSLNKIASTLPEKPLHHSTLIHSCGVVADAIITKDDLIYPHLKTLIKKINAKTSCDIDLRNPPQWLIKLLGK